MRTLNLKINTRDKKPIKREKRDKITRGKRKKREWLSWANSYLTKSPLGEEKKTKYINLVEICKKYTLVAI